MGVARPRDSGYSDAEGRVLAVLREATPPTRFVTEIVRTLDRRGEPLRRDDLEAAMARLEERGEVLVREYYCADPHLEGVDLRIAGVVPERSEGDSLSECVREIEGRWQEWLTAYLAEHRCT
jgi:hypothetical protein